jgi:hypothetical protein
MTIYHLVIFRLKAEVTPQQVSELETLINSMVGKLPGMPLANTSGAVAHR